MSQDPTSRQDDAATLAEIQTEVGFWQEENFDDVSAVACLLKTVSEIGELCDVEVARAERCKGATGRGRLELAQQPRRVEAADVLIAFLGYCARAGIDLDDALRRRWAVVSRRDYRSDS